jgi:quinol monooxygenase YgiN
MIFIVVKWTPKPEHVEDFPNLVADFTNATRAEPGNLFFEWSRSLENPSEYVLVEGFRDGDAGGEHVNSVHFKTLVAEAPNVLASTALIISHSIDADGWSVVRRQEPVGGRSCRHGVRRALVERRRPVPAETPWRP